MPRILPFLLLPPLTLLHSLHCLDAIQMFFFSTPLWREPTPIVHKINPIVPADPALRTKHAHTVCNSFMSRQSCILSLGHMIRYTSQRGKLVDMATIATLFGKFQLLLITKLNVLSHTHKHTHISFFFLSLSLTLTLLFIPSFLMSFPLCF